MKYLQASIFHPRLNYDSDLPQMAWADLSHRPISDVDSSDYICLVPAEVQKTNCCLENLNLLLISFHKSKCHQILYICSINVPDQTDH